MIGKKFKIFKSEIERRIIYRWAYQCPKCETVMPYDFERCLWALDSGGLCVTCRVCGFNQIITIEDLQKANLITEEEYSNLQKFQLMR
jgi:RNase P subunit RPR2